MVAIDFWYDFGSPNAYLAHRVIPELEARLGVAFAYRPALLGGLFKMTGNSSPVDAYRNVPHKLAYERLEFQRFIERYGISDFIMNPHFPINTLQMMRGAVAASELELAPAYVDAVFNGMWTRQRQMGDAEILAETLEEAGLPARQIFELSQAPHVKSRLLEETQKLYAKGAFGIPTFFVGDEIYFGKDKLRDVEESFLRQTRESSLSR